MEPDAAGLAGRGQGPPRTPMRLLPCSARRRPDIRDNWAESYLRMTPWGDPWMTPTASACPTRHRSSGTPPRRSRLQAGRALQAGRTPFSTSTPLHGEVVTIATDGLASVHDDAGHSAVAFIEPALLHRRQLRLPPGNEARRRGHGPEQMSIPFVAAFNAPEGGIEVQRGVADPRRALRTAHAAADAAGPW